MLEKHLYEVFAKRWYRGGTIWFYSDPHFSDPEMVYLRKNYIGDDEQIRRINSKIGKNDTLIILGDIGDVSWVAKLRGYKVLIMGNHDKGATNYERKITYVLDEEHGSLEYDLMNPLVKNDNRLFDEVYEGCLMISDKIILSHEPIPHLPEFMFNIHGHDHSNWFTGSRHLNCCAEHIDYTPISIKEIVNSGVLKDIESIHRLTIDEATERKLKRKGNHE